MRKPMDIDFERCTSGIEFEEWVKELLGQLRMKAERIQCKHTPKETRRRECPQTVGF